MTLKVSNLSGFAKQSNVPTRPFADNFDDNSIDATKWTSEPSTDIIPAETSSEMRFPADASFSGSLNIAFLNSVPSFDFTGKKVEVDLPSPSTNLGVSGASPGGGTGIRIQDNNNANNYAEIFVDNDSNTYRRSNNGSNSESSSATGHSTNTKWRITHNLDNTWTFATFDGGSWTDRFTSVAANWNPTSVKIRLYGYIYNANQVNVTSRFDNVTSDALY